MAYTVRLYQKKDADGVKGVGRRLIETLADHLRENGVKGLMLDVAKDNTGAQAFYEKVGFHKLQEGKEEITYGMKL